jgi:hypothetical protein
MKKINYQNYKRPSDFMKFEQGENRIRVVSEGVIAMQHGLKTANRYVNLGFCTEKPDCPHCKKGNEPKRVWKWIVFDYANRDVKLLDAGPMLGNQLCEFGDDPQKFDVIVTRSGTGLDTKYKVTKAVKSESFTDDILVSIKNKKARLIDKYFKK